MASNILEGFYFPKKSIIRPGNRYKVETYVLLLMTCIIYMNTCSTTIFRGYCLFWTVQVMNWLHSVRDRNLALYLFFCTFIKISFLLQTFNCYSILGASPSPNPTSGPNPGGPAETKTLTISQTWSQEQNGYERLIWNIEIEKNWQTFSHKSNFTITNVHLYVCLP